MNKHQSITTIMQTQVVTVSEDTKFSDIKDIFRNNSFHHIPVVEKGKVIGMVTETDLIKVTGSEQYQSQNPQIDKIFDHAIDIKRLMHSDPVTIVQTATIGEAINILLENRFHALPVVDNEQKLVGIVTTKDLLRCLIS